ncbi:MAG: hypothetical protein ACTSUE_09375 [Promethearchaeota archaeon]
MKNNRNNNKDDDLSFLDFNENKIDYNICTSISGKNLTSPGFINIEEKVNELGIWWKLDTETGKYIPEKAITQIKQNQITGVWLCPIDGVRLKDEKSMMGHLHEDHTLYPVNNFLKNINPNGNMTSQLEDNFKKILPYSEHIPTKDNWNDPKRMVSTNDMQARLFQNFMEAQGEAMMMDAAREFKQDARMEDFPVKVRKSLKKYGKNLKDAIKVRWQEPVGTKMTNINGIKVHKPYKSDGIMAIIPKGDRLQDASWVQLEESKIREPLGWNKSSTKMKRNFVYNTGRTLLTTDGTLNGYMLHIPKGELKNDDFEKLMTSFYTVPEKREYHAGFEHDGTRYDSRIARFEKISSEQYEARIIISNEKTGKVVHDKVFPYKIVEMPKTFWDIEAFADAATAYICEMFDKEYIYKIGGMTGTHYEDRIKYWNDAMGKDLGQFYDEDRIKKFQEHVINGYTQELEWDPYKDLSRGHEGNKDMFIGMLTLGFNSGDEMIDFFWDGEGKRPVKKPNLHEIPKEELSKKFDEFLKNDERVEILLKNNREFLDGILNIDVNSARLTRGHFPTPSDPNLDVLHHYLLFLNNGSIRDLKRSKIFIIEKIQEQLKQKEQDTLTEKIAQVIQKRIKDVLSQ